MDHIAFHRDIARVERVIEDGLSPLGDLAPGEVVAALTSGTDSRTVLAILRSAGGTHPDTFTNGSAGSPDVRRAQAVSKILGLRHEVVSPSAALADLADLDEAVEVADGSMDPSRLSLNLRRTKERGRRYRVALGGGGGPLYKDHFWLYEFNRVDKLGEPNWARIAKFAVVGHPIRGELTPNGRNLEELLTKEFARHSAELESATIGTRLDYVYATYKIPIFSGPSIAAACRLCDTYEPFLDAQNVASSTSLAHKFRKQNYLQFAIINKILPSTRWIVTNDWLPFIPATGCRRPLRLLRGIRYTQAARRKVNVRFRGRSAQEDPARVATTDDAIVDVFVSRFLQCAETGCALGSDFMNATDQLSASDRRRYQVAAGAVAFFVSKVRSEDWRLGFDGRAEADLAKWLTTSSPN